MSGVGSQPGCAVGSLAGTAGTPGDVGDTGGTTGTLEHAGTGEGAGTASHPAFEGLLRGIKADLYINIIYTCSTPVSGLCGAAGGGTRLSPGPPRGFVGVLLLLSGAFVPPRIPELLSLRRVPVCTEGALLSPPRAKTPKRSHRWDAARAGGGQTPLHPSRPPPPRPGAVPPPQPGPIKRPRSGGAGPSALPPCALPRAPPRCAHPRCALPRAPCPVPGMRRRRGAFSVEPLRGRGELLGGVPGVPRSCRRGPSPSYQCWGGALRVPSSSKLRCLCWVGVLGDPTALIGAGWVSWGPPAALI